MRNAKHIYFVMQRCVLTIVLAVGVSANLLAGSDEEDSNAKGYGKKISSVETIRLC